MSHALDEALDNLNWAHLVDCAVVDSVDAACDCDEGQDACAA